MNTLIIPLAFVIVAALLLWFIIGAKGKWWIKLILIAFVPSLSISIWQSLDSYLGWPTPEELPSKFVFVWGEIREPNLKSDNPGAIYVWLWSLDNQKEGEIFNYKAGREPRAYKIPYNRKLHEQIEGAKEMIKDGKYVLADREGKSGKGKGESGEGEDGEGEGEDGEGESGDGGDLSQEQEWRFYELPSPRLPEKNR